jgi:ABC-type dipeptide/oligopeptide/nickel transport system permease component
MRQGRHVLINTANLVVDVLYAMLDPPVRYH